MDFQKLVRLDSSCRFSLEFVSKSAARAAQKVYPVCGSSLVLRFLVHVGDMPRNNCDPTHQAHTRVCFAGQDDSSSLSPRLRAPSTVYTSSTCRNLAFVATKA